MTRLESPERLAPFLEWLRSKTPEWEDLTVENISQVVAGHSNETWLTGLRWTVGGQSYRKDYILRTAPAGPGLLEPYDVAKQYHVMKALASSVVPVPEMYWVEEGGDILGKPFFLMEKLEGYSVERRLPEQIASAPPSVIESICHQYISTIAAVHNVDWRAAGLGFLGDGEDHLRHEIDWWERQIRNRYSGNLPSFEAIMAWLRDNIPLSKRTSLVHGDPKLGNILLNDSKVIALLDWEMATIGNPLCDIGWFAFMWNGPFTAGFVDLPGALDRNEMLERYQELSGVDVENLQFYEALQGFKLASISFVGLMLYESGENIDPRFKDFGASLVRLLDRVLSIISHKSNDHGDIVTFI